MIAGKEILEYRQPEHEIEQLFVERWSPRAFSGEGISPDELMSLFEAARWAPSCYNDQPWRFLYAHRDTPDWEKFLGLLVEGNRAWAKNASVLIAAVSTTRFAFNGKPNPTHSFDCGSAWQNMALQASRQGLATHGMAGFHREKAIEVLRIPEDHRIEAMIAVGRPGHKEDLPENLRQRESPSGRKKVEEFVIEGGF